MRKVLIVLILILLFINLSGNEDIISFEEFLAKYGITKENLGFHPDGTWSRFPNPEKIPYISSSFIPLFKNPLKIYDYANNFYTVAKSFANFEYFEKKQTSIYKLLYYLGIDKIETGFRCYGFPIPDISKFEDPLKEAIKEIYNVKNRNYNFYSIDRISDYPRIDLDYERDTKELHKDVKKEIAEMLFQVAESYKWWKKAFRNVSYKDMTKIFELRDLIDTQYDAMEYFPEIDDVMSKIDLNSFYYSCLRLSFAAERLAYNLKELRKRKNINWNKQNADINTPLGKVIVRGSKYDRIDTQKSLLIIDFGGNDKYYGNPGGNSDIEHPFGILIDLSGNDKYNCTNNLPSMGAGILGMGILIDVNGNDNYRADFFSQGAGLIGVGILADFSGTDSYTLKHSGQGTGYFGVGMLLDYAGRDFYRIWANGQGLGGTGGVGILIDSKGDDYYYAEPSAKVTGRGDYHSENKLSYSYAQGCGVGRRGDISDGHSWAGGIGALIDIKGNDKYTSANWSLGSAYWFGIGILYDGEGDDRYKASVFSLASGAHYCISTLIDENGNDRYIGTGDSKMNFGFGHDYTVSLFLDKRGNDKYSIIKNGFGFAINMSQSFFLDLDGDDTYEISSDRDGFGIVNDIKPPFSIYSMFYAFSSQLGLFIDANGKDKYIASKKKMHIKNNFLLKNNFNKWNYGINAGLFIDTEIKTLNWFKSIFLESSD